MENLENFNVINYLNVVDISLLNLLDVIDLDNANDLIIQTEDKYVLNFNSKTKKLLTECIVTNINNEYSYGKTNILVGTCSPLKNWRKYSQQVEDITSYKLSIQDETIHIDILEFNKFLDALYRKLAKTVNSIIADNRLPIQKNIKVLNFEIIDVFDVYQIMSKLLENIGTVNKGYFVYNIIDDENKKFSHTLKFSPAILDVVRLALIKNSII